MYPFLQIIIVCSDQCITEIPRVLTERMKTEQKDKKMSENSHTKRVFGQIVAEGVGFEPTCRLITDKTISSVVRLWQIHLRSRSFQAAL